MVVSKSVVAAEVSLAPGGQPPAPRPCWSQVSSLGPLQTPEGELLRL